MQDTTENNRSRNSLVLMLCTLTSRLLGIVKARVLTTTFGASQIGDVINFTYNIPNSLRKMIAEGAVSPSFIPVFSDLLQKGKEDEANRIASTIITLQVMIFIPLLISLFFFGQDLIELVSAFEGELSLLGGRLLVPFFLFLLFISINSVFMAMLNSHNRFLAAASSPLLYSLSVIFSVHFLTPYVGPMSIGLGAALGGLLQMCVCAFAIARLGYRFRPSLSLRNQNMRNVFDAYVPTILTSLVSIASLQISYYFASTFQEGSVTAFANSLIIYQTPFGIFYVSIVTIYFPLLARQFADNDAAGIRESFAEGLYNIFIFIVPSMLVLFFFSDETIAVLLQNGLFTHENVILTSKISRQFIIALIALCTCSYLSKFCYAIKRHRLAFRVFLSYSVFDVILTVILIHIFGTVEVLPVSNHISNVLGIVLFCAVLKGTYIDYRRIFRNLLKVLIANIPLLVVILIYRSFGFTWHESGSTFINLVYLALLFGVCGITVLVQYRLFRIPFLEILFRRK